MASHFFRSAGLALALLGWGCSSSWAAEAAAELAGSETVLLLDEGQAQKFSNLEIDETHRVYDQATLKMIFIKNGFPDDPRFSLEWAGRFDAVVSVNHQGRWACTGIVVGPKLVLTSDHCRPADSIYTGWNALEDTGQRIDVIDQVLSPGLGVKLLRLKDPVGAELPLAATCFASQLTRRRRAILVGYGLTDSKGAGLSVRTVGYSMLPANLSCEGATAPCSDAEFALRASPGLADTCRGDSGGPLMIEHKTKHVVLGVTQGSIDGKDTCGQGGIYTRAYALESWARPLGASFMECN